MKAHAKAEFSQRFPSMGRKFRRIGLPPKQGSFQLFVTGYQPANFWLKKFESCPPSEKIESEFLYQFQKLTCLDYIIRNTDRGGDNWLIRYESGEKNNDGQLTDSGNNSDDSDIEIDNQPTSSTSTRNNKNNNKNNSSETIQIAAIDNGLAFPYKHPDAWRTYPYSWSRLEIARKPFLDSIIQELLPLISDVKYVNELETKIYNIFKIDRSFSRTIFDRQMAVMRGQILNLQQALRDQRSPLELVNMPPVYVRRAKRKSMLRRLKNVAIDQVTGFTQSFQRQKPFFTSY